MPQLKVYQISSTYNNKRSFSYDKDQDYAEEDVILPPWILTPNGELLLAILFSPLIFVMGCMKGLGLLSAGQRMIILLLRLENLLLMLQEVLQIIT